MKKFDYSSSTMKGRRNKVRSKPSWFINWYIHGKQVLLLLDQHPNCSDCCWLFWPTYLSKCDSFFWLGHYSENGRLKIGWVIPKPFHSLSITSLQRLVVCSLWRYEGLSYRQTISYTKTVAVVSLSFVFSGNASTHALAK